MEDVQMKYIIEGKWEDIKNYLLNHDVNNVQVKIELDLNQLLETNDRKELSRKDVVLKARRDIKNLLSPFYPSGLTPKIKTFGLWFDWLKKTKTCEFVVNPHKRTVVALIKDIDSGNVIHRGIAKCHPDDCFNADIGKAIALRRALGLEIPEEYLNAPNPKGLFRGDIIILHDHEGKRHKIKINSFTSIEYYYQDEIYLIFPFGDDDVRYEFCPKNGDRVIDDSNREYYEI